MGSYQSRHTGSEIDAGIDAANAALPKSGGTMTGTLILNRNPVSNYEASTKQYVDQSIAGISNSSGMNGKDGVGIQSISKTGTSGLVDTYTITLTDNTQYTFTVTNGKDGSGTGTGSGGNIYMQVSGGYIQFSNDGLTWHNVIALSDIKGSDGADGFSPTVNVVKITGGNRVTITDANGAKTFDVMDGKDGSNGSGSGSAVSTSEIVDLIYPVGSIYMSANSTSPATLFGGSWTRIQDRFLLAAGSSYSAGATGGEASHTLTTSEMPAHSHGRGTMNIYGSLNVRAYDGNGDTIAAGNNVGGVNAFSTSTKGSGEVWGNSLASTSTDNNPDYVDFNAADGWEGKTEVVGGNAAHNNMPPYLAVYIWKRTA